jgi:hypothetical protein
VGGAVTPTQRPVFFVIRQRDIMNELKIAQYDDKLAAEARPDQNDAAGISADWSDVSEFNAALNGAPAGHTASGASPYSDVGSLLSTVESMSSGLRVRMKAMDKALVKGSRHADPEALNQFNKEFAQVTLETSIAIKVISKVEQAVEQLTRLQ